MSSVQELTLELPGEQATVQLAVALARAGGESLVVYLSGPLGAGKSTLARAWLRELGVTGPIKSPTYTLLESYPLDDALAMHLDLYRLAGDSELEYLGLREMWEAARLVLIEWPEKVTAGLPLPDMEITLEVLDGARRVCLRALSGTGRKLLQALKLAEPNAPTRQTSKP